jgi:hypothetical protein
MSGEMFGTYKAVDNAVYVAREEKQCTTRRYTQEIDTLCLYKGAVSQQRSSLGSLLEFHSFARCQPHLEPRQLCSQTSTRKPSHGSQCQTPEQEQSLQ